MAKGKSGYVSFSGSNGYNLRVYYEQTYDENTLVSTITITKIGIQSNYYAGYSVYVDGVIKVNGVEVCTFSDNHGVTTLNHSTWYYMGEPESTTVKHGSDGSSAITISIHARKYSDFRLRCSADSKYNGSFASNQSRSVTLTPVPVYSLTLSPGTGSIISVNRTYSPAGSTGALLTGAKLWNGDKIKITFSPQANYKIISSIVNGSSFVSGNTHTVTSNVTVKATAQPLASEISATDANIESASTIVVTRYDSSYTHTITYTFGSLSGTIVKNSVQTTISWTVPSQFYSQIPNSPTGRCTLVCSTYSGDTLLGSDSYSITVTAAKDLCSPSIVGTVMDVDPTTTTLTGDSSILIRYKSDVLCEVNASSKNASKLTDVKINGSSIGDSETWSQSDISSNEFVFSATDSRGYSTSMTVKPEMIPYVRLTINPVLERPSPTTGEVTITFNGNYYNGSFGAYDNTLTIRYRYRKTTDPAFGEWHDVPPSGYAIGVSTYYTQSPVSLGSDFDYKCSYVFEVQAYDGADNASLDTVSVICPIQKGLPVFDWGEDDFNFNVTVKIRDVNIFDVFYPVGSVYTSVSSTIPESFSDIGEWTQIDSGNNTTYQWKRVS